MPSRVLVLCVASAAAMHLAPPPRLRSSRAAPRAALGQRQVEPPDFLITDSVALPAEQRPSLLSALLNPRDGLAVSLTALGLVISAANLRGDYGESYLRLEAWAIGLGFASAAAAAAQLATGYNIRRVGRKGTADDGVVTGYGGGYTFGVSWLAWRASALCPAWLATPAADHVLAPLAIGIFAFGVLAPAATLWGGEGGLPGPALTETETLRARGLLAVGAVGAVFIPDCIAFMIGGQEWWGRVAAEFAAQRTLESSTSIFALLATEASMVAHRCGKAGVAPFSVIVPTFVGVCVALALAPCVAALSWLGDDISFFSFYSS